MISSIKIQSLLLIKLQAPAFHQTPKKLQKKRKFMLFHDVAINKVKSSCASSKCFLFQQWEPNETKLPRKITRGQNIVLGFGRQKLKTSLNPYGVVVHHLSLDLDLYKTATLSAFITILLQPKLQTIHLVRFREYKERIESFEWVHIHKS